MQRNRPEERESASRDNGLSAGRYVAELITKPKERSYKLQLTSLLAKSSQGPKSQPSSQGSMSPPEMTVATAVNGVRRPPFRTAPNTSTTGVTTANLPNLDPEYIHTGSDVNRTREL